MALNLSLFTLDVSERQHTKPLFPKKIKVDTCSDW